jgi:hypothetical protein
MVEARNSYAVDTLSINDNNENNDNSKYISIRVPKHVVRKLDQFGRFKESYGDLIDRLLSEKLSLITNSSDGGSH